MKGNAIAFLSGLFVSLTVVTYIRHTREERWWDDRVDERLRSRT